MAIEIRLRCHFAHM